MEVSIQMKMKTSWTHLVYFIKYASYKILHEPEQIWHFNILMI